MDLKTFPFQIYKWKVVRAYIYSTLNSIRKKIHHSKHCQIMIDHTTETGHGPANDLFLHLLSTDHSFVLAVEPLLAASPCSL